MAFQCLAHGRSWYHDGTTSLLEITLYRAGLVVLWILARAVKRHLHEKSGSIRDSALEHCRYSMKRSEKCAMMWKDVDTYRCEIIDFVLSGKKLAWKSVRLNCWMHQPYISVACFCSYRAAPIFCDQTMLLLHLIFANLPAPEFDGPKTYHFMTFSLQGHIGTLGWEPLGVDRPGLLTPLGAKGNNGGRTWGLLDLRQQLTT